MPGPIRGARGATQLTDGARCAYRHLIEGYGALSGHAMMAVTSFWDVAKRVTRHLSGEVLGDSEGKRGNAGRLSDPQYEPYSCSSVTMKLIQNSSY